MQPAAVPQPAPHYQVPQPSAGGGTIPRPGEVSLAHNGVLFLDELPEFSRETLEALRQPLEDRVVTVSRVHGTCSVSLPVHAGGRHEPLQMRLSGASDPCLHLYAQRHGGTVPATAFRGRCSTASTCTLRCSRWNTSALAAEHGGEPSADIRARVIEARARQLKRYEGTGVRCNADLPSGMLRRYCRMDTGAERLLRGAFERMGYSARAYDRILRVARTIADLDHSEIITAAHLSEVLQYRSLDRNIRR